MNLRTLYANRPGQSAGAQRFFQPGETSVNKEDSDTAATHFPTNESETACLKRSFIPATNHSQFAAIARNKTTRPLMPSKTRFSDSPGARLTLMMRLVLLLCSISCITELTHYQSVSRLDTKPALPYGLAEGKWKSQAPTLLSRFRFGRYLMPLSLMNFNPVDSPVTLQGRPEDSGTRRSSLSVCGLDGRAVSRMHW